ncbi:hypothetical protein FNW25_01420 [Flavobacterium franklandianum]|uniref:hypothetical protein n=1 Tax=Flavobacterium franklandianum TaxID=2594430 RepID=UPI00117A9D30|nr:hypothetical protein [Flavobacterium franklandianum]TRX29646.1 hypothetical protein FNW25_01420 [Flavobacterium franklandianum]
MSIFKTIGNKLKRAISLKNVINAATGNFTAVTAELKRVATTSDPKKGASSASQVVVPFEVPKEIENLISGQASVYQNNLAKTIGNSKMAQNNVNDVNSLFSKIWWQATWTKNKTWIIVGIVAVGSFIGWLVFRKKPSKGRVRR